MSNFNGPVVPVRLGNTRDLRTNNEPRRLLSFYETHGKRALDIVIAGVLLIVLSPLLVLIALLVAQDGGTPFFVHRRAGLRGRSFGCVKFRTMVLDAERRLAAILARDPEAAAEWRANFKLSKDHRVTPVGRFLRKTSLDELPQLWNVLCGDMSIVGPRPVTREELQRYGRGAGVVLSVRPGMTGLWQVVGRGRATTYAERVEMDLRYVETMTLRRDMSILVLTSLVVLRGTGS